MSFKLIGNHLSPAEGEVVVRTYHCTNLSPVFALIGLKTDGYLTVTNKRVVYFAEGSSVYGAAGNSKLYNEVPIADVANISLSKGARFSLLRLLCGILCGLISVAAVISLSSVLLPQLNASFQNNPYLLRLSIFLQLTAASLLILRSLSIARESITRFMLASSSLALLLSPFVLTHNGAQQSLNSIYQSGVMLLGIPLVCYSLWCLYWFIRREYLLMSIASKSGFSNPISIVGVSWWGRINVAAHFASGMAPAVDADAMFKELGAMVTDIQTLGDHGIQKWLQIERDAIAKDANENQEVTTGYRKTSTRYALATIVLIGLFVCTESIWYASGAKKRLALQMRNELASARTTVENDTSMKVWVPKLLASAEQEAVAGETAFGGNKFTDATAHWKVAIGTYTTIPNVAVALKTASTLQSQYKKGVGTVYLQETASERLKSADLLKAFMDLIDQHPSPNEPWKAVKESAAEARGLDEQDKWEQTRLAWDRAGSSLPGATRLMHADILVKLAENEIKKGNASGAANYADNALKEMPGYSDAMQRKELALNMIKYAQWLSGEIEEGTASEVNVVEFTKQLDLSGGGDWTTIKGIVENARSLANKNDWDKSNDEWNNALTKLPNVILANRLEKLETEARRGNWAIVSKLAVKVLRDHSDHLRANELKRKADGIESARAAALGYQRAMSGALNREVASNQIKIGDMRDFIAHMDRYGQEEWMQIKDAIGKAEAFGINEQGVESANEWSKANTLFPSAIQRMRAEIWMEQAGLALKSNNWTKVLIYAESALREKPDHVRAKQLRDQADPIEKKRLMQTP